MSAPTLSPTAVTWGPLCACGNPTRHPHRHGSSRDAIHLSVTRPWGRRRA